MNKTKFFLLAGLIQITFLSCATTVKFRAEHPPLVDLRGVSRITVIPLEWSEFGRYRYLADYVTRALTSGVKKAKIYNFVNPSNLKRVGPEEYSKYVDVYISGKITGVVSYDRRDIRARRENRDNRIGAKRDGVFFTTRTVIVEIEYKYIRAGSNEVLDTFRKRETSSVTFEVTGNNRHGPDVHRIAQSLAPNFSNTMVKELVPWATSERRKIEKEKDGDPHLAEAGKLIRKKNYPEAFEIYRSVFTESGNITAGFNAALLLEADNKFEEAVLLLDDLGRNILKSSLVRPDFIINEITRIKELISDNAELDYYRNR